jgi:hypothetical protein
VQAAETGTRIASAAAAAAPAASADRTDPCPAGAEAASQPAGTPAAGLDPALREGIHVLYVDDDEVNVLLVEALLATRPSWRLSVAGTGQEGIRLARTLVPDVLLLDLQLPDVSGIQVREQLAADPATAAIPCVLLTADVTAAAQRAAEAAGFAAVQHKPVKLAALLEALNAALRQPGRRQSA